MLTAGSTALILVALPVGGTKPAIAAESRWTSDNGNGTYSNPLFYEEFEDPDVIRVGDDYYLAGTTMHMNPGVQIMHSKDLVNWQLASYCIERLDLGPAFRLEGGNVYGRGIWAPCIRYRDGMFYVFTNVNGVGLQVFLKFDDQALFPELNLRFFLHGRRYDQLLVRVLQDDVLVKGDLYLFGLKPYRIIGWIALQHNRGIFIPGTARGRALLGTGPSDQSHKKWKVISRRHLLIYFVQTYKDICFR